MTISTRQEVNFRAEKGKFDYKQLTMLTLRAAKKNMLFKKAMAV